MSRRKYGNSSCTELKLRIFRSNWAIVVKMFIAFHGRLTPPGKGSAPARYLFPIQQLLLNMSWDAINATHPQWLLEGWGDSEEGP